jgi:exopolyphosphatase / guanosine-5'-triphosphate,3'-diphosphate pyrophosphatase
LLHDIGWSRAVNGSAHHKHSSDLIREHAWTSLNTEQIDLVAQIARYHRKSLPKVTHQPFTQLRPASRHKLLSLAALLRMADAMDRSHQSLVRSLECVLQGKTCLILAQSMGKADAEVRALEKKGDLFELHFCLKIEANFLSEKTSTSTRIEPV